MHWFVMWNGNIWNSCETSTTLTLSKFVAICFTWIFEWISNHNFCWFLLLLFWVWSLFIPTNVCSFFSFPSVFSLLFSYFSLSFTAEFCWARKISSHHNKIDGCKFSVTTRYTNLIQNIIHAYILQYYAMQINHHPTK